jgi:hypothetical protein
MQLYQLVVETEKQERRCPVPNEVGFLFIARALEEQ